MKNIVSIITLSLVFCSLPELNAQTITYSGPVKCHIDNIAIASGGGTDAGYNWNVSINEKMIIDLTFYVTFSGSDKHNISGMPGMFIVTSIDNEDLIFTFSKNNVGNKQKLSQTCSGDNGPQKVSPGDSESYQTGFIASAIDQAKSVIEGGFLRFNGNEYDLLLTGNFKYDIEGSSSSEKKLACTTGPAPTSYSYSETLEFPIAINGKGKLDKTNTISGYSDPVDIANMDCRNCIGEFSSYVFGEMTCSYSQKMSYSWDLTRGCDVRGTVTRELDKHKELKDFQKERIIRVLEKLEDPSVDANVFLSAQAIQSITTEEQADKILQNKGLYMDDLRKLFNKYCEGNHSDLTRDVIRTDRTIIRIINMFNEYYLREHMLSDGQVKIKDWIADQQRNPNSIYSCYTGE